MKQLEWMILKYKHIIYNNKLINQTKSLVNLLVKVWVYPRIFPKKLKKINLLKCKDIIYLLLKWRNYKNQKKIGKIQNIKLYNK